MSIEGKRHHAQPFVIIRVSVKSMRVMRSANRKLAEWGLEGCTEEGDAAARLIPLLCEHGADLAAVTEDGEGVVLTAVREGSAIGSCHRMWIRPIEQLAEEQRLAVK